MNQWLTLHPWLMRADARKLPFCASATFEVCSVTRYARHVLCSVRLNRRHFRSKSAPLATPQSASARQRLGASRKMQMARSGQKPASGQPNDQGHHHDDAEHQLLRHQVAYHAMNHVSYASVGASSSVERAGISNLSAAPILSSDLPELPVEAFAKHDPSPDPHFYREPRFVTHIDAPAIAAVTRLYAELLPPGGVILDLMSSWVSHLPLDRAFSAVIGHGLNPRELDVNPRLTQRFVQDLNADQHLPLESASVDAALICVSVQYLQRPVAVLSEVARVLRPGSPAVLSFSNRCFPTKAVAIWSVLDATGHAQLIDLYLRRAGFARTETRILIPEGDRSDPMTAVIGWAAPGA